MVEGGVMKGEESISSSLSGVRGVPEVPGVSRPGLVGVFRRWGAELRRAEAPSKSFVGLAGRGEEANLGLAMVWTASNGWVDCFSLILEGFCTFLGIP